MVTKASSDNIFGPDGLGLAGTPWATLISWLARNGITDQTHSDKNTTDIESCVRGWGQGAYSSRVFNVDDGVDQDRLIKLIHHLEAIAEDAGTPNNRITEHVLGIFVQSQHSKPYSTWNGERTATSFKDRTGARFRAHIQWQGFIILCGQLDHAGVKHVTPQLLRDFFNHEQPFFQSIVDRRHELRDGSILPGEMTGLMEDAPSHIDPVATDKAYMKNKSGLLIILKIARYMLTTRPSARGSL